MLQPKVIWANKSFLDYRVPVYAELDRLLGNQLWVLFSKEWTPARVQQKISAVLGDRAIGLDGEYRLIQLGNKTSDFANRRVEAGYQPGLFNKIQEINPDLLIGEGFFQWTFAALSFCVLQKRPLIVSYERTHHTERNSQWYRRWYRKAVLRRVDAIACNGSLSKEYLQNLGFPGDRIVTGSMAADTNWLGDARRNITPRDRQATRARLGCCGIVFLYAGQLVARKGVRQLLDGWRCFNFRYGSTAGSLLIVGDGVERPALEEYIDALKLPNVILAGAVDYDQIVTYYNAADVFVIPTLEDNWSLVVPEAMACGLPVASSIYNGCWPELVHPGVNGYLFDPFRPEEIAEKLALFLGDPDRVRNMGQASQNIGAQFSPTTAAQAIFDACARGYSAYWGKPW